MTQPPSLQNASTGNSFDSATASGNDATAFGGFEGSFDSATASGNLANANAGDNGTASFSALPSGEIPTPRRARAVWFAANNDTAIVLGNLVAAQPGFSQADGRGSFFPQWRYWQQWQQ